MSGGRLHGGRATSSADDGVASHALGPGAGLAATSASRLWPAPAPRGQASVELLGLLPLALLVALAIAQLLAAGSARELAGNAAEAGAAALLQGTDPTKAARDALPGWSRDRAKVAIADHRVEVHLRPRTVIPLLANRLEAHASADTGPPT